jgi:hypothetical protein
MYSARAWRSGYYATTRAPVTLQVQELFPERAMPRLIALTGPAGHGKDSVAAELEHTHGFARLSFAAPLKDAIAVLFCIPRADLEDRERKEAVIGRWNRSPRQLMQWLRAEVRDDFFLLRADAALEELMAAGRDVVVSDCRFDNEARHLTRLAAGALYQSGVWGVDASVRLGKRPAVLRGATALHATEAGLDPALLTATVDNNGPLAAVGPAVAAALAALAERGPPHQQQHTAP